MFDPKLRHSCLQPFSDKRVSNSGLLVPPPRGDKFFHKRQGVAPHVRRLLNICGRSLYKPLFPTVKKKKQVPCADEASLFMHVFTRVGSPARTCVFGQ